MHRQFYMALAWVAVLWIFFPAAGLGSDAETKIDSWEDYSLIIQRNIFSRTRRARIDTPVATVNKAPAVVRSEQSYLVLRGVVREGDAFISFIEDSRTGEVKRARQGETVGGGMLSEVSLDHISFKLADADTRVPIGSTLEGEISEAASSSYYSGGGFYTRQESGGDPETIQPMQQTVVSEDKAKDILERLKERRKKELGE